MKAKIIANEVVQAEGEYTKYIDEELWTEDSFFGGFKTVSGAADST